MGNSVPVGASIRVLGATVELTGGEEQWFHDAAELAKMLVELHKQEMQRLSGRERAACTGYRALTLHVEIGGIPVTWLHQRCSWWQWPTLGNPKIVLESHPLAYSGTLIGKWTKLPRADGTEWGEFFSEIQEAGKANGHILIEMTRPGPIAHEDYALLMLEADPNRLVLAQGTVGFFRSNSLGDLYRELYRAEMLDPDHPEWGRGDHVGNTSTVSTSFGV